MTGDDLEMSIDGSAWYPLVDGVTQFDLTYFLAPCVFDGGRVVDCTGGQTNEPLSDPEWQLAREVRINATVKSKTKKRDVSDSIESGEVKVKPRNLI